MRTRVWCTSLVLASLAVACGDQPTEVVPEREMTQGPGIIALATSSSDDGLSITTDKDDYQPGDTVRFTGAGWPANDTLDIVLEDEPATHPPHTWWIPVRADGTFRDSTYVVDVGDLGVTFTLTASSRATERSLTVQFTDATLSLAAVPSMRCATVEAGCTSKTYAFSPNGDGSVDLASLIASANGAGAETNIRINLRPGASPGALPLAATLGVGDYSPPPINKTFSAVTWTASGQLDGLYTARVFSNQTSEPTGSPDPGPRKVTLIVDRVAPAVSSVTAPESPTPGQPFSLTASATDTRTRIFKAEYSVDGAPFLQMSALDLVFDELSENVEVAISDGLTQGQHTLCVRAEDAAGNRSADDAACLTLQITPAIQPTAFSGLSSPTITYGDTPTILSGKITAGAQIPTGNVSITLDGVTKVAAINSADGTFSSSFSTGSLGVANSPYNISYQYGGDGSFGAAPDGLGTLTVIKATPAFSNLSSPTIRYGDTPTTLSGTIGVGGLIPTGNVSVELNGVTQIAAINPLNGSFSSSFATNLLGVANSPYTITYEYAGDPNFNQAPDGNGTLTVNRAPLTVTLVSPQQIVFGDKPDYSVSYSGFVNGESESDLSGALVFYLNGSLIADPATFVPPVGLHKLTAGGLTSDNYAISYAPSGGADLHVVFKFLGFFQPVDNPTVLNAAKAGQGIPLKWQILDYLNNPILNLTIASVAVTTLNCSNGAGTDQVEEYTGASGLQDLGGGYYQFNWKSPKGYAGACKTLKLDLGEGITHNALFMFKN